MKKAIFLAAAISALSITATYAQDTDAPPPPPKEKKEGGDRKGPGGMKMYEDLNLTQEQKDKIKAIEDENRPKLQAIRQDASLSDDDKRSKSMELRKAQKEKIDEILTPEQKTKLDEKMKKMREERKGGPDKQ
ncbi:MAG: hypothetical protein QM640_05815 [Niabella sp.]